MLRVQIVGQDSHVVQVSPTGEIAVSPVRYNETVFKELAEPNIAYNFYGPHVGEQFVLVSMLAYGDKQVGTSTNATVIVYEGESIDTITISRVLLQFEVGQNQSVPFAPINVLVNKGVWINAQTDDDDIHMTLLGYYINEIT